MTSGLPRHYAELVDPILAATGVSFDELRFGKQTMDNARVLAAIVWTLRQKALDAPRDHRWTASSIGGVVSRHHDQVRHLYDAHALRLERIDRAYAEVYGARYR